MDEDNLSKKIEELIEDTADDILKILEGRKGFCDWWDELHDEDQIEIRHEIDDILREKI